MRFFGQQNEARARTRQLLLLFALAVALLVLAINAGLALTWWLVTSGFSSYPAYFFTVNTVVTLVFVPGGVLRKVAGAQGMAAMPSLHPAVQHMLLVGDEAKALWFDSHPPLAERIRRIYGRVMPTLTDGQKQGLTDPWGEVLRKDRGE